MTKDESAIYEKARLNNTKIQEANKKLINDRSKKVQDNRNQLMKEE